MIVLDDLRDVQPIRPVLVQHFRIGPLQTLEVVKADHQRAKDN